MAGEMIRVEGIEAVKAMLAGVDASAQGKAMHEGLKAGGLVFLEAVQTGADRARRSKGGMIPWAGVLADDVIMWFQRIGTAQAVIVGFGRLTWQVAGWVEYGHRMIKRGGGLVRLHTKGGGTGRVIGNVPAYPFIRPAYESQIVPALMAFGKAFMANLKEKS